MNYSGSLTSKICQSISTSCLHFCYFIVLVIARRRILFICVFMIYYILILNVYVTWQRKFFSQWILDIAKSRWIVVVITWTRHKFGVLRERGWKCYILKDFKFSKNIFTSLPSPNPMPDAPINLLLLNSLIWFSYWFGPGVIVFYFDMSSLSPYPNEVALLFLMFGRL